MTTDLLALTTELVDVPSVSHHEAALADLVEGELRGCHWLHVHRLGDNVVARTELGRDRRVVMAGHLDTVPPAENTTARVEGDVVWGVGSADMKGGLAVMLDLARTLSEPAVDVTWCFYACEELSRAENGLDQLWRDHPGLLAGDAAILGEPTSSRVEAGCQGTARYALHLGGVRAHTARPFTGRNAIHRLAEVLTRIEGFEPRVVTLDGCEFAEQLQAVRIEGGIAGNVVPDSATLTFNYRYAPDRQGPAATAAMMTLFDGIVDPAAGDRFDTLDQADGAPPALDHPILGALVAATGEPPRAKVGWTDVASFWSHGVPAANFGPGDPLLAHHPDERVDRASLDRARSVLRSLLLAPGAV